MDTLAKRGIVEVQPGRPLIFRATPPKTVINQFVEDFNQTANEVIQLLIREKGCTGNKLVTFG